MTLMPSSIRRHHPRKEGPNLNLNLNLKKTQRQHSVSGAERWSYCQSRCLDAQCSANSPTSNFELESPPRAIVTSQNAATKKHVLFCWLHFERSPCRRRDSDSGISGLLQPRPIKHAGIGFRVAPGGPAVAGRPPRACRRSRGWGRPGGTLGGPAVGDSGPPHHSALTGGSQNRQIFRPKPGFK